MTQGSDFPFIEGALPGIRALAPYQPGKPIEELQRELGLSDIIKLASNENPLGPSKSVQAAITPLMSDLGRYPDGNGFALKQALAERYRIATDCLTLGNGSNDILEFVARIFLRPGLNAVVSDHAFAIYALATQAVGAELRAAPANPEDSPHPYGHDLVAMSSLIDADTAVVFIANPNNPTGTWFDDAALKRFLAGVPPEVVVVLDEAYAEYVEHPAYPTGLSYLQHYPNLIVTRTFSKAFGLAGLRVGYAVSHPKMADLLNRVRQPFNVNLFAQTAAVAALADADHLERSRACNREGLQQLHDGLARLGLYFIPSVANFVSFRVPNANGCFEALLKSGVIVRPISGYGLPDFLRVSVGLREENERFLRTLEGIIAS